jgi:hypothetical protein
VKLVPPDRKDPLEAPERLVQPVLRVRKARLALQVLLDLLVTLEPKDPPDQLARKVQREPLDQPEQQAQKDLLDLRDQREQQEILVLPDRPALSVRLELLV